MGVLASVKQLRKCAPDTIISVLQRGAKTEDKGRGLSREASLASCLVTQGKAPQSQEVIPTIQAIPNSYVALATGIHYQWTRDLSWSNQSSSRAFVKAAGRPVTLAHCLKTPVKWGHFTPIWSPRIKPAPIRPDDHCIWCLNFAGPDLDLRWPRNLLSNLGLVWEWKPSSLLCQNNRHKWGPNWT